MKHIEIIVGSQMGSAEYAAEQIEQCLVEQDVEVTVHLQPVFNEIEGRSWLVITSTYGAGDYPDNLLPFIDVVNQTDSLQGIDFAVIGIGDSSYDTFNYAAKNAATLLTSKGAQLKAEPLLIDVQDDALPEDTAAAFVPSLIQAFSQ
jgi:MioC protein